jgi:SAM-dependent methyltransferase
LNAGQDDDARYYEGVAPLYTKMLETYGDDPRSVFTPKGRQGLRYAHLLRGLRFDSILDVGCGTGLLKDYLDREGLGHVRYTGVDIVEGMVELCRRKFPGAAFQHVRRADEVAGSFDVVLLSGTFNIVPAGFTPDAFRELVFATLERLFAKATRCLAFDFMNDLVDFRQEGAFHLSHAEALAFATARLSRRFELIHSYMPYESAMRVFAQASIDRRTNVFADED